MRIKDENKTENNKKCGKRLKECRIAKGLSQSQLAEQLGVVPQQISNYECGTRGFQGNAIGLSKILNVDADYLLCTSDFKNFHDKCVYNEKLCISHDDFLIRYIILIGNSIKIKKDNSDELLPYDTLNTYRLGGENENIVLNGTTITMLDFQYMLDDMKEQINSIVDKAKQYAERRATIIADESYREAKIREEKSMLELKNLIQEGLVEFRSEEEKKVF